MTNPQVFGVALCSMWLVAACKSPQGEMPDSTTPGDRGGTLVFRVQPTASLAGSPIAPAVVVAVEDSQGNALADSTTTVTIVDSFGLLQGTTSAPAIAGVATFDNLYLLQAASGYALTATSTEGLVVTSNAFDVALNVPATLSLFGLDKNQQGSPLPAVKPGFGLERLWDSGLQWAEINAGGMGSYTWTKLDAYLREASQQGVDEVLYTFGNTPGWAQMQLAQFPADIPTPVAADCRDSTSSGGPGMCFPPSDLNWDGTGTNAAWKAFVTALATHVKGLDPNSYARIRYWEVWNEPDASPTLIANGPKGDAAWWGSYAQLVRMAEDARCIIKGVGTIHNDQGTHAGSSRPCALPPIDATAMILSPSAHPYVLAKDNTYRDLSVAQNFMHCAASPNTQLRPPPSFSACTTQSWGSDAVDAINMHMKISDDSLGPEHILNYIDVVRTILTPAELSKPIFNDEAGFGDGDWTPQDYVYDDMKEAFVGRYYFLQWGNVASVEWFTWENVLNASDQGCGLFERPSNVINGAGIAYATMFSWISGAQLAKPCSSMVTSDSRTIWTCGFTKQGTTYQAIWDTSVPCDKDTQTCATMDFSIDSSWRSYQDITGANHAVSDGKVPIGKKVIVLSSAGVQ